MSEKEFQLYVAYSNKKGLPNRILELQLAQVSQHIVNMASESNKYKLTDFLLHEKEREDDVLSERDFAIAMGFKVD